jgi:hypothetical protein
MISTIEFWNDAGFEGFPFSTIERMTSGLTITGHTVKINASNPSIVNISNE